METAVHVHGLTGVTLWVCDRVGPVNLSVHSCFNNAAQPHFNVLCSSPSSPVSGM